MVITKRTCVTSFLELIKERPHGRTVAGGFAHGHWPVLFLVTFSAIACYESPVFNFGIFLPLSLAIFAQKVRILFWGKVKAILLKYE